MNQCAKICKHDRNCVGWQLNYYPMMTTMTGVCRQLHSVCDYGTADFKKCGMFQDPDDPFVISGFSEGITEKTFAKFADHWTKVVAPPTTTTTTYTTVPGEATTITTTTTTPFTTTFCAAGMFLNESSLCSECPAGQWTAHPNDAGGCTEHHNCSRNEYMLFGGRPSHPNVCIDENDNGYCPPGEYRLNILPRQWIEDEYENTEVMANASAYTNLSYNVYHENTGLTAHQNAFEKCLKSHVLKTNKDECEDLAYSVALALNDSVSDEEYRSHWLGRHSFHVCAEQTPQCDLEDTQYESAATTNTSDRTCDYCPTIAAEDADPDECPRLNRDPAPRECTFPYRFAASQSNLSNASDHPELCCRVDQSGTLAESGATLAWVHSSLRNVSSPLWDPNVHTDTMCVRAQATWHYTGSCNTYQLLPGADDPPIIEPRYALVDGNRECTFATNYECTYACSARRCRHYNATVVTGCDNAVLPHGKLLVNEQARADLEAACTTCLKTEHTTASSTTIAGAPTTTVASAPPPTRSPKRRYIYVGLLATAIVAWCFIFSKHE